MLTLKIDTRETDIKEFFKDLYYVKVERLPLGDIIFQWKGKDIWIIERKEIKDFAHSIRDGRFREQKMRLLSNYKQEQILYLIEGNLDLPMDHDIQTNLPVKTLYSSMYNMLLRDNLKIYKTNGIGETLRFLKNFVWKMQKQGTSFMKNYTIEDYHDSNMKMKISKKKDLDKTTCFLYQLCQIKGVSQSIASVIVQKHPSWIDLYNKLEHFQNYQKCEYIADIKVPVKSTSSTKKRKSDTRKIGQKTASRIYTQLFT